MRKLSQTLRIALVLFLAMFSGSIVPAAAAYATNDSGSGTQSADNGTYQPVWCHHTGNHWTIQIGDSNSGGRNDNYPLLMTDAIRALGLDNVDTSIANGSQAYAHDRSDKIDASFCVTQFNLPIPTPTVNGVCGLNNDTVTVAANPNYTWTFSGWSNSTGTVTITATSPYTFSDGQTVETIPITEVDTSNCTTTITTLPQSTVVGVCGLDNDTIIVGAETEQYSAGVITQNFNNGTARVTYAAKTGYVFPGGNSTYVETVTELNTTEECRTSIPVPATPEVTDPCGENNATWVIPKNTDEVSWSLDSNGHLVADTNNGYVFTGGQTSYDFGIAKDSNKPCQTACTLPSQTYIQPWNYANTTYPEAGAYPSGTPGTYQFINDSSFTGLNLNTPATESYVDGLSNAGNRPLSAISTMSYKTYRNPSSTGDNRILPAYILEMDKDGNPTTNDTAYLFYEPLYNGTVQTGVWQTWDAYNSGNAKWWGAGDSNPDHTWNQLVTEFPNATVTAYGFNQGTYNAGANTYVQHLVFDCATTNFSAPGKGSVTPPSTPPQAPAAVMATPAKHQASVTPLPAELPHTGPAENSFFLIAGLLIAIITYGAVYFAQPKRQYE